MNIEFLPLAYQDLKDTVDFYAQISPATKRAFESELVDAIEIIKSFPLASRLVGVNIRKLVLKRFPHLILYTVFSETIIITAVAHQHRHPDSYLNRS